MPTWVWSVASHLSRNSLHAHWGPVLRLLAASARDDREVRCAVVEIFSPSSRSVGGSCRRPEDSVQDARAASVAGGGHVGLHAECAASPPCGLGCVHCFSNSSSRSPPLFHFSSKASPETVTEQWLGSVCLAASGALALPPSPLLDASLLRMLSTVLAQNHLPSQLSACKTYRASSASLHASLATLVRRCPEAWVCSLSLVLVVLVLTDFSPWPCCLL